MLIRRLRPVGEPVPGINFAEFVGLGSRGRTAQSRAAVDAVQFGGYRTHWYGSGTSALAAAVTIAIRRGTTQRPEVIIPAYCCPDVLSAVQFVGAAPVLVDFVPSLPWLDPRGVAAAVTRDTVAVINVRLLGLPTNESAVRAVIGTGGPLLIEDSAHLFPASDGLNSRADLVVLSFGRGKPVPLRRGGVLLQRLEADLQDPPQVVRDSGARHSYFARLAYFLECLLYNGAIQPAVYGLLTRAGMQVDRITYRELRRLDGFPGYVGGALPTAVARHRSTKLWHQEQLRSMLRELCGPWTDVAELAAANFGAMRGNADLEETHLWRYPLLFRSEVERDTLFDDLWKRGHGASRLYQRTLSGIVPSAFRSNSRPTPEARSFAQRLLTLPVHSDVREIDYRALRARLCLFALSGAAHAGRRSVPMTAVRS